MRDHVAKLPNAPLQEVIFEIHWELDINESNLVFDPQFDLALGVFANKINKEFPFRKRLIPANFPIQIADKPIYQFWRSENTWPVIQLGQGIMTVNDVEKNYIWEKSFETLIQSAIKDLLESYNNDIKIRSLNLKYINAVELSIGENLLEFINNNLQIDIQKKFEIDGSLSDISFNETYVLPDQSMLNISITNGHKGNIKHPALIWQITVFKNSVFAYDQIYEWLTYGHSHTSNLFRKMLSDNFYDSFK